MALDSHPVEGYAYMSAAIDDTQSYFFNSNSNLDTIMYPLSYYNSIET